MPPLSEIKEREEKKSNDEEKLQSPQEVYNISTINFIFDHYLIDKEFRKEALVHMNNDNFMNRDNLNDIRTSFINWYRNSPNQEVYKIATDLQAKYEMFLIHSYGTIIDMVIGTPYFPPLSTLRQRTYDKERREFLNECDKTAARIPGYLGSPKLPPEVPLPPPDAPGLTRNLSEAKTEIIEQPENLERAESVVDEEKKRDEAHDAIINVYIKAPGFKDIYREFPNYQAWLADTNTTLSDAEIRTRLTRLYRNFELQEVTEDCYLWCLLCYLKEYWNKTDDHSHFSQALTLNGLTSDVIQHGWTEIERDVMFGQFHYIPKNRLEAILNTCYRLDHPNEILYGVDIPRIVWDEEDEEEEETEEYESSSDEEEYDNKSLYFKYMIWNQRMRDNPKL